MAPHGRSGVTPIAERLERGEVVVYPVCPFSLPDGDAREFLFRQQLGGRSHKNISFNPHTGAVSGFRHESVIDPSAQLRAILAEFSQSATTWMAQILPHYATQWKLDRVSFRPEEEATRQLRVTARNDLLHVDAFPTRPTNGWRILRVFVNINPDEPRIWVTADTFPALLLRFGAEAGLPNAESVGLLRRLSQRFVRLMRLGQPERSAYDAFMLRFHHFLKRSEHFQEKSIKQYWSFPPGAAWMVMADTLSHAVLRGRYALEHSYFIAPHTLVLPELAPAALLAGKCEGQPLKKAA